MRTRSRSAQIRAAGENEQLKSEDDEPVALTFREQARQRSKTEEATRASVQASKKRAKQARRAKLQSKTPNAEALEDALQLPEPLSESVEEGPPEPPTKKSRSRDCDEFHLADTFDFRQYLPKEMLMEDKEEEDEQGGSDGEADFEEEELSRAIMEGYIDSDEGYHGSDEQRPVKKGKKTRVDNVKPTVSPQEAKPANRRGGRRVRKKHSAAPRVIILGRTDTETVRQRTDAFVTQRLFSPNANGPFIRRMNPATLEALSAKRRVPFRKK